MAALPPGFMGSTAANCLAPGFVACCMTNYAADATLRDRCAAFCSTGPAAGDLACLSSGC